jgi:hypothetical protein
VRKYRTNPRKQHGHRDETGEEAGIDHPWIELGVVLARSRCR